MGKLMQAPPLTRSRVADLDDEDMEADSDYEDELLGLLARLEHLREGLAAAVAARRPAEALERAMDLMGQVKQFSGRHFPFAGPEVRDALARAADFHAAFEPLRSPTPSPTDEAARHALTRRCYTTLCDAVLAFFVAFTNRFPTSRAARGWVEVAATYAADLKRTTREAIPSA